MRFFRKKRRYKEADMSSELKQIRQTAQATEQPSWDDRLEEMAVEVSHLASLLEHQKDTAPQSKVEGPNAGSDLERRLNALIDIVDQLNEKDVKMQDSIADLRRRVSRNEAETEEIASTVQKLRDEYEPKDFRGLLQNSPKWVQKMYFPARTALAVSIAGIILSVSGGHAAGALEWSSLQEVGHAAGAMFLGTAIAMALLSWVTRPRKFKF